MNYAFLHIFIFVFFYSANVYTQKISYNFTLDECIQIISCNTETEVDTLLACELVFEKDKKWNWYVHTNNLASITYYINSNNIKAIKHAEIALKYAQKHLEKTDTNYLDALHNNAFFYTDRLLFGEAIELFKEVIEIDKKLSHTDNEQKALTYNSLAYVYQSMYDFESASHFFQKAIDLVNDENKTENLPAFHSDLGNALVLKGDTSKAIAQYKVSLKLILEDEEDANIYLKRVAFKCYTELSEIYLNQNDLFNFNLFNGKATNLYQQFGKELFKDFKYYELQGDLVVNQNLFEDAIANYKKAEKALIDEQEGFGKGGMLAKLISKQGNCYAQLNLFEKAIQNYQKALYAICKPIDNLGLNSNPTIHFFYDKRTGIEILSYKAKAFRHLYQKTKQLKYLQFAKDTYHLIAELLPITRRDFLEENSKFQLANETNNIFEEAIETCYQLYQINKDDQYLKDAFFFIENSKAIVLQEAMQKQTAIKGLNDSLQSKDIKFKADIAYYENLIGVTVNKKANAIYIKQWKEALFELKETYEAFKQQIEVENPNYYTLKYATAIADLEEVQENLNSQMALIEYFVGKKNLYIFLVEKDKYKLFKLTTDAQLKQDIDCLKEYIRTPPSKANFKNNYEPFVLTANSIFNQILKPVFPDLSKQVNQLVIIPDKYLWNISYDALLTTLKEAKKEALYHQKNLSYLYEDFSIAYSYSSSFLLKTRELEPTEFNHQFIGYAPKFTNLFKNEEEVTSISQMFKGNIRLGQNASYQTFQKDVQENLIIHLATHASQNLDNHKLSTIQFSDSIITNYHIENMKIKAALAVLSACETGSGFIQDGEGAMSLARSFFLAGCPSLVSTIWTADDDSTESLMLYFYQYLKAGETKDVALQRAKLQYCNEAGLRESHPFYWAGFVLSGNYKALF